MHMVMFPSFIIPSLEVLYLSRSHAISDHLLVDSVTTASTVVDLVMEEPYTSSITITAAADILNRSSLYVAATAGAHTLVQEVLVPFQPRPGEPLELLEEIIPVRVVARLVMPFESQEQADQMYRDQSMAFIEPGQ